MNNKKTITAPKDSDEAAAFLKNIDRKFLVKDLTPEELAYHDLYEKEFERLEEDGPLSLRRKIRAVKILFKQQFTDFGSIKFNRKVKVTEAIIRKKIAQTNPMFNGFPVKVGRILFHISTDDYKTFEVRVWRRPVSETEPSYIIEFAKPFHRPCNCMFCNGE